MTAAEFSRSFRGTTALLARRPGALACFEFSEAAFLRSFGAVALTAPAFVVDLALLRTRLGPDGPLFGSSCLVLVALVAHLAAFLALPLAMALLARRCGFTDRYVPFAIVTNWLAVFASYALALPGALLLLHLETPALATLFEGAFLLVALVAHWEASRLTLRVGPLLAASVPALGLALSWAIDRVVACLLF